MSLWIQASKNLEELDRVPQVGDLLFQTRLPNSFLRERLILILKVDKRNQWQLSDEHKTMTRSDIWVVDFYDFDIATKSRMNIYDRTTYYLVSAI